jgi:hopanoid-associated phosphorylase
MDREVIVVCGMRFEAGIARGPGVRTLFPASLRAPLPACRGIVSFGFAGALDPSLVAGDCLLPETVLTTEGPAAVDSAWRAALLHMLPYAHGGVLAGVGRPVLSTADKSSLRASTGAGAVDMESDLVAQAARRNGLPFVVLRVIVDTAARSVPTCAVAALDTDGSLSLPALARSLAAHPSQLPALLSLAPGALAARRSLHAARALAGDAFALPGHFDGGLPSFS